MASDPNLDEEMQALFASVYLRLSAARGAVNAQAITPESLRITAIPDPRSILCPLFNANKDKICTWLKQRLGSIAGGIVCAALSALCG